MEELMVDALRESVIAALRPMTIGPILGAMSLTQIWRLDRRHRTKRTPRTYECAAVNTAICWALMTVVYGTLGDAGWLHAAGMGVMVAPAAPLLWALGGERLIECVALRMCGRREPRSPGDTWSDEKRRAMREVRDLYDTLSDRDKVLGLKAEIEALRKAEKEWRNESVRKD